MCIWMVGHGLEGTERRQTLLSSINDRNLMRVIIAHFWSNIVHKKRKREKSKMEMIKRDFS